MRHWNSYHVKKDISHTRQLAISGMKWSPEKKWWKINGFNWGKKTLTSRGYFTPLITGSGAHLVGIRQGYQPSLGTQVTSMGSWIAQKARRRPPRNLGLVEDENHVFFGMVRNKGRSPYRGIHGIQCRGYIY